LGNIRPTKSLKVKKYVGLKSLAYSGDSDNRILLDLGMSSLKVTEVRCKNALVKSRIESMDYALNPYTGCQHGCLYCYAEFMKKYTNHKEDWGAFVDVKINAADRLREQIKRSKPGKVMVGTVTDAYQPLERKYRLTRRCLEILADSDFPVFIQTKSDLVLRDSDILKRMKEREVGFTISTHDPEIQKLFEPGASALERRFVALEKLQDAGIPTFAFVGPILPFFSDNIESLRVIFQRLEEAKVNYIYLDKMNYLKGKWKRINPVLKKRFPHALRLYEGALNHEKRYTKFLKDNLTSVLSEFSFDSEILF
jgi:DNA repair photolyase